MGRNNGSYRRPDFRTSPNGYADRNETVGGGGGNGAYHGNGGTVADSPPIKDSITERRSTDISGMISGIDKRLAGVQQDFTQQIHKMSEKENEKFDLIFAILSELQTRQAQLEESVRSLKAQYGSGHMVSNGAQPQQTQFGSSNGSGQFGQMSSQMNGQMGGQMNGNMQFAGVMQGDGTQAMFTAMPQMMIVQSPTNGAIQYNMPQMMTTTGAVVQQMPAQMAMQFVGQSASPEMGMTFVSGQEACGSTQAQVHMNMHTVNGNTSSNPTWQQEDGSTMVGKLAEHAEAMGNDIEKLRQGCEAARNGMMSCSGSLENSSQEGKLDDSPGQAPSCGDSQHDL
jgi:hypothetical protein